jgi:hypothetical protein
LYGQATRLHGRPEGVIKKMEGIQIIKYEPARAALKNLPPHSWFLHTTRYINIKSLLLNHSKKTYKKGLNYIEGNFVERYFTLGPCTPFQCVSGNKDGLT